MYADLLAHGLPGAGSPETQVDGIRRNTATSVAMLEDLVAWTPDRFELQPREVKIIDELAVIARDWRPAAESRGVRLNLELPDALSARVDPAALDRVIWNLLRNAGR